MNGGREEWKARKKIYRRTNALFASFFKYEKARKLWKAKEKFLYSRFHGRSNHVAECLAFTRILASNLNSPPHPSILMLRYFLQIALLLAFRKRWHGGKTKHRLLEFTLFFTLQLPYCTLPGSILLPGSPAPIATGRKARIRRAKHYRFIRTRKWNLLICITENNVI